MQNDSSFGGAFAVIKGVLLSLATALVCTVLFSLLLRFGNIPQKAVYPVNQVIKTVAIALGVFLSVRGEKGWLKGGAIGIFFTALSYLAFAAIGGDFSLSWLIFVELLCGVATGVLCGVISVNTRR